VADTLGSLPYGLLPIYYGLKSVSGEEFWACVYGTYGQVTQIFFPNRDLVVFDIAQGNAEAVIASLQGMLSRRRQEIEALIQLRDKQAIRCIGLLDMVSNFGHQAINHLSGIQRLIDLALLNNVDEVWTSGILFFGNIESTFPELQGRVRYFATQWDIASEVWRAPYEIIRLGSTYLSSELKSRILKTARFSQVQSRQNLLVVTVRTRGRVCINLAEVVGEIYKRLHSRFELKLALDGWVLPESAAVAGSSVGAAVSDYYVGVIREEIALAGEIAKRLPPGSIVMNTIGRSMLESLNDLNSATAYFSHVGTLQHKLGLLLSLPGVVHGPKSQVSDPEGGSYLSEEGVSPVFMPENLVEDIPTLSIRGQSFADYRILDVAFPTERLSQLMK
jgi:hypothetical protein